MKCHSLWLSVVLALGVLPVRGELIISEFLASNLRNLADEDGAFEDWIEIRNTSEAAMDLRGWFLTDSANDKVKWQFPATNLNAGASLIVFASSKDRRVPGLPLHTNFKLSPEGEYLALIKPDRLTATTVFAPAFPPQFADVSYGFGLVTTNVPLVVNSGGARLLIPTVANGGDLLGDSWKGGTEPFLADGWMPIDGGAGYSGADVSLVSQGALALRLNFDAAPVSNVLLDTKPAGTPRNGVNRGADWIAVSHDGSQNPVARSGTMGFVAANSDQVTVAANADFNLPQGTLSMWVRSSGPAGVGTEAAVLFERRTTAAGLQFLLLDDGRLRVIANSAAGAVRNTITTSASVGDKRWHHVAVTFEQAAAGSISISIDGQPAGSSLNTGTWAWPTATSLAFGKSQEAASTWRRFNGALDDIRLYNSVLSSEQLAQIYSGDGGVAPADYAVDLTAPLRGISSSVFARFPFVVGDPSIIRSLLLRVKYDDGYAVWLNGRPLGRSNVPDPLTWDSQATAEHSSAFSETLVQAVTPGLLRSGTNILAFQGANLSASDPTFLLSAELTGFAILDASSTPQYFTRPTPAEANGVGAKVTGPTITEVGHSPKVPNDDEDLWVTSRIAPSFNNLSNVVMRYRVMFTNEVVVPMKDDGRSHDGLANDGVFGAVIPASAATHGQMVRYLISAEDVAGNVSRWPLFHDPTGSEEYLGTVVNPSSVSSPLPVFHLFVSAANIPKMDDEATGGRVTVFHEGELYDNIHMELRGNTSAGLPKKSHRVEFHREKWLLHEGPGGRVRKTSFIAEHLDPTYMRQGLSFWLLNESGTPAPFYYPVRIQRNGEFYQLASHTDVLGEDQLERMGYDPRGALYKAAGNIDPSQSSTGGFEKKTRTFEGVADYQALAAAINESRPLATRRTNVFEFLDVPNVINYLACARWVQEGDDVWANMSIYRDSEGDKLWRIIPFDMNLSWGALYYGDAPDRNFGVISTDDGNKSHPLYGGSAVRAVGGSYNQIYDVIIQVPETRQMLLRRMRSIMDEWIQPPATHPLAKKFEQRITWLTNQMWTDAFIDRAKWKWPDLSGPYSLGPNQWLTNATQELVEKFIEPRRYHWFVTHAATNVARPIGVANNRNAGIPEAQSDDLVLEFGAVEFNPSSGNQAQEFLTLTNPNPVAVDLSGWTLSGGIDFVFKGGTVMPSNSLLYVSPDIAAFRNRTVGPRAGLGLFVVGPYRGQISARGEPVALMDRSGRVVATVNSPVQPTMAQQYLRVTEIMFHPTGAAEGSPYTERDYEFVELRNTGDQTLDLGGIHFTNGLSFEFTGSAVNSLGAGERVLVVKNRTAFLTRYPTATRIAGEYAGTLDNTGERLTLHDGVGEVVLDFAYSRTWYPVTDGAGFSLVFRDDRLSHSAWDTNSNWRASSFDQGSPGVAEPTSIEVSPVLVNEILSNPLVANGDAVELINTNSVAVDISGWYLSDDFLNPRKYLIPANTVVLANSVVRIAETAFNSSPGSASSFALGSSGDGIYLFSADSTRRLTGFAHGTEFGPSLRGVTFGRHLNSVGIESFPAQLTNTLGALNAGPAVGPVIISEFLYNAPPLPAGVQDYNRQFVALRNVSSSAVPLFDPAARTNTWRIRGDVDFDFPTNVTLTVGEQVVVVGFDPAVDLGSAQAFRADFQVPVGVRLFGPFRGDLGNGSGIVRLGRPNPPTTEGIFFPVVDEVAYDDQLPWSPAADGWGGSLHRREPAAYANDPASWVAALPSPGRLVTSASEPQIVSQPQSEQVLALQPVRFEVSAIGSDLSYQWFLNGGSIDGARASVLELASVLPGDEGNYQVAVVGSGGAVMSEPALLQVSLPLAFAVQPKSRFVTAGTNVTFSAPAVGVGEVRYQWRRNGQPISGATGYDLNLTAVQPALSGVYDVLATDDLGSIVSQGAQLVVSVKPAFVFQPQARTVLQGETVTLFTTVSGTTPLWYRWSRSARTITNQFSLNNYGLLVITNIQTSNAGPYTVTVTNLAGATAASPGITLTVLADVDQDGMSDAWEALQGFSSQTAQDASLDADGDGVSNRDEYVAGTDPRSSASRLSLSVEQQSPAVVIRFNAISNQTFSVLYRTNLDSSAWLKWVDVPSRSTNRLVEVRETNAAPDLRLYRVVAPAQP